MAVLIDTSFLLAAAFHKDSHFEGASRVMRELRDELRVVTAPVLGELFYMTMTRMSYRHAVQVFTSVRVAFQIEGLEESDMARMQEIMSKYADNRFDYVDVSIMAVAERLKITRICTLDQRDFRAFRPTHYAYFEIISG